MSHVEFPALTPQTKAAYLAAFPDTSDPFLHWGNRRCFSAFLREAMNQAFGKAGAWDECWDELNAIADNLHSPSPPPPPTLAQALAADLDTPEGKAAVRDFLATLGEGGQL